MDEAKIIIRNPIPEDTNFILSTWLKGQRFGSPLFKQIPASIYFEDHAKVIQEILSAHGTAINIACDLDSPAWIVGFAVARAPELYWIHVRKDYRRKGIAKLLLGGKTITTVRAMTKVGWAISEKHGLTFKPL